MPRAIPANEDHFSMLETMFGFQEGSLQREHLKSMLLNNIHRRKSRNEKPPVEPSPYETNYLSQCLVRSVKAIVFLALLVLASLVIIITFDVVTIKYMLLCMLAFISFGCVVLQLIVRAWKPLSQWLGRRLGAMNS
ncbi:BnaA04g17740D [Brassica napus]|uniref:(rape) hypothetical protein n=1 Tax=Brassica napus TaxID=3708 RepID=A0A078GYI8_BRANA|nr:unnamed protein product [Brassica napus]CDY29653.1 BnaA04g17740D [Brassica napus]